MSNDLIIEIKDLRKYYPIYKGFIKSIFSKEKTYVHAVDGINFNIKAGETLGLVGESGCGKTTAGLLLLKLIEPTSGSIFFQGVDIATLSEHEIKEIRKKMQIIFQNPYESLSPRFNVLDAIAEPLRLLKVLKDEKAILERVKDTLKAVGLPQTEDFFERFPHELSGGQRQRIGVARAFVLNPLFIVADEPVSMLDVSIRVGVLRIMKELVQQFRTGFLFITHDLALARYMCDRVAVMYLGRIVEEGKTEEIIQNPLHPYTKALISAVPIPDPDARRTKDIPITGEVPSGIFLPLGCRFHPRCIYAKEECRETDPELVRTNDNDHFVACIRYNEIMNDNN
ncbi:MAG: ABC transporter ATP-binding protein [Candidatus Heimdallarchaeota archaeon]|nr:MAG: ABC transporter ATP-binding protein [Candidatus Heimdallarchaeota archaeon]